MCACTEPVRTAVCVEYGRPKWPITMLNHTNTQTYSKMFCFYFQHPMLVRPAMKRLFCLKAKNGLGRFAPSALPHHNTRFGFSQKRVHIKKKVKHAPHESSRLLIVIKSMSYPLISPFLRDNDPQVHLPAANCVLRRVQVQFGRLKSDWDQVWAGSGCQSPGRVLWWQACVFYLVAVCAWFMPYTMNRQCSSRSDTCTVYTYEYVIQFGAWCLSSAKRFVFMLTCT